jgi:phenylacetate-coenzyme A ligase PaaK-like adenylate-forming protein
MVQASIQVENISDVEDEPMRIKLQKRLREVFALRIPVDVVKSGTLPQFEMKAKRWNVSD